MVILTSFTLDSIAGWLFLFAVLVAAALLFTMVFYVSALLCRNASASQARIAIADHRWILASLQIIMFSDLECDYINPIDLCNKLNQVSPATRRQTKAWQGGIVAIPSARNHCSS